MIETTERLRPSGQPVKLPKGWMKRYTIIGPFKIANRDIGRLTPMDVKKILKKLTS